MVRYNDIVHNSFLIAVLSLRLMVRLSEIYRYSLWSTYACANQPPRPIQSISHNVTRTLQDHKWLPWVHLIRCWCVKLLLFTFLQRWMFCHKKFSLNLFSSYIFFVSKHLRQFNFKLFVEIFSFKFFCCQILIITTFLTVFFCHKKITINIKSQFFLNIAC